MPASKFTPEIAEQIIQYVREGMSLQRAAPLANVGPRTAYDWFYRGEGEDEGPFHEFHFGVRKAESEHLRMLLAAIRNATDRQKHGEYRRLTWEMERRYPYEYGDREGPDSHEAPPTAIEIEVIAPANPPAEADDAEA